MAKGTTHSATKAEALKGRQVVARRRERPDGRTPRDPHRVDPQGQAQAELHALPRHRRLRRGRERGEGPLHGEEGDGQDLLHPHDAPGRREAHADGQDPRASPGGQLLENAVRRMLPRSALGRQMLTKLKVYAGDKHPHAAQKPEALPLAQ